MDVEKHYGPTMLTGVAYLASPSSPLEPLSFQSRPRELVNDVRHVPNAHRDGVGLPKGPTIDLSATIELDLEE